MDGVPSILGYVYENGHHSYEKREKCKSYLEHKWRVHADRVICEQLDYDSKPLGVQNCEHEHRLHSKLWWTLFERDCAHDKEV